MAQGRAAASGTAVRDRLKRLETAAKAVAGDPQLALGPWEVAGTDHDPRYMRCLLEGARAAAAYITAAAGSK